MKPSPPEPRRIRVLFIEDNDDDVALERETLRSAGFDPEYEVVETSEDLRAALDHRWDVIISDYQMPELSGLDALRISREVDPDIPFILVSGTVGEDVAVDCMRAGAHDYVLKGNLTRLASAVEREVREIRGRRRGRHAQQQLRLLAEAGAVLSGSLEVEATLQNLAQLVTRFVAPLCIIDLLEGPAQLRRAAVSHRDAAMQASLDELAERHPMVVLSEEPAFVAAKEQRTVVSEAGDSAAAQISQTLGLARLVAIPLRVHGPAVGAISVGFDDGVSEDDLGLMEELGRRAAVIIENARLYEQTEAALVHAQGSLRQAREAIRVREEFITVASHELRTPLTAMQLNLQSIGGLFAKLPPACREERLGKRIVRATESIERLTQLVENLLEVSELSDETVDLRLSPVDLARVARDVVGRVRGAARRAGCEVTLREHGSAQGIWDRLRLEQALTNLVSNAIKYGGGKPIEVEATSDGDGAVLRVIDHGIGLPAEAPERIFQRFERGVPVRHYGGLGLGLYITHKTVEAHGGRLSAQATPGGGATFTIRLPPRPPVAAETVS